MEFAQRVGDFIIRTSMRIARSVKHLIKSGRYKRLLPLFIVFAILLISFVTCISSQAPSIPEDEPPATDESPPSSSPVETEPVVSEDPGPSDSTDPGEEPSVEPTPSEEPPEEYTGPYNPLTGVPVEKDISKNRPLAIMMNNHRNAQPQLGISKADIVYEMLVEGTTTRMLALFQDVTGAGKIGSIRSARPYYVDIAESYDSVYIFAGGSDEAYRLLSSRGTTRLDGVNGSRQQIFYRDPERQHLDFEHRLVTSSTLIEQFLPTYNFRLEHDAGFESNLTFSDDAFPINGYDAKDFTVKFSASSKTTTFSYNAEDCLYYLEQYGETFRDGNDGSPVTATNVLILRTAITQIDSEGRLRIITTGAGSGYYASGGKYIEIDWYRANDTAQFEYRLKDGSDLALCRGKTYICIVNRTVDVGLS